MKRRKAKRERDDERERRPRHLPGAAQCNTHKVIILHRDTCTVAADTYRPRANLARREYAFVTSVASRRSTGACPWVNAQPSSGKRSIAKGIPLRILQTRSMV
ncbi:MAG: hypothetical protein J0I13_12135 [Rhizobiales bacterium]|jgi:hypothetical protein|nr:hypothetical protein [Hyphomicrobiales bacterium]